MPQRPRTHQRPPHHLWTGDTSANSTPSLDEGLHGQLLRTELPPDGIANDPTVGAVNKIFSNNWPLAHFVLNVHHWSIQCNFQAEVSHVKGVDNDYADELSRRESTSELIRRGWNAEKQFQFQLQEILCPSRGKLFPAGAAERAPPRLAEFTSWPEEQSL
jgi:hypothetical protein